jgi:predicted nucleic acid-binding protein
VKQRIYLDTSVISALEDTRWPERAELTRLFWAKRDQFELCTSDVARIEIGRTNDAARRTQMTALLSELRIHPLTTEMDALARDYVDAGVFPEAVLEDALHVAAAVLVRSEVLVSWNFKHLVNRRRRAAIVAINLARGLPTVEIIAPPEL